MLPCVLLPSLILPSKLLAQPRTQSLEARLGETPRNLQLGNKVTTVTLTISMVELVSSKTQAMDVVGSNETPVKVEEKRIAVLVCWILGFGSLVSWSSMLTIGDYYYAFWRLLLCLIFYKNSSKGCIAPGTKWEQVKEILAYCGRVAIQTQGFSSNPLGSALVYRVQNNAFEVMKLFHTNMERGLPR